MNELRRQAMLDLFAEKFLDGRTVVAFGGYDEAQGLPDIHRMGDLAKHLGGGEITHAGMGVFQAKRRPAGGGFGEMIQVLCFCGGGAMDRKSGDGYETFGYTTLDLEREQRPKALRWLRKHYPAGFLHVETIKALRRIERLKRKSPLKSGVAPYGCEGGID